MAIIQVPYTVRVWAHVDTESGEVVKVVEDIENIALDGEGEMLDGDYEPLDLWNFDAERVAEEQEWPAWDR